MPVLRRHMARVAQFPPGATWGPRTLTDFEFVWLLQGEATWYWEDTCLALRPGDLLLTRPGMRDRFVWDPDRPTWHAFAHFELRDELSHLGAPESWPLARRLDEPLEGLCRYLLRLAGTGGDRIADARQQAGDVLTLLITLFVRGPLPAPGAPEEQLPEHILRVADYVREAWSAASRLRPVSLAEMAGAGAISRRTLCRTFQDQFGLGPVTSLERIRLSQAAEMLLRSNMSIRAIADGCGYANPYHFSRQFRATYGVSPRDYRRGTVQTDPLLGTGLLALANHLY